MILSSRGKKKSWHRWVFKIVHMTNTIYVFEILDVYLTITTWPVSKPATCWCRRGRLLCCSQSAEQSCSPRKPACNAPELHRQQHGVAETWRWTVTTPETWEKICKVYMLGICLTLSSRQHVMREKAEWALIDICNKVKAARHCQRLKKQTSLLQHNDYWQEG